jgi:hypothetical protein
MQAVRNEFIYDFFEDELILDSLMLILDAEGRLSIKHHKKWDDPVPSLFIPPNPSNQMHPKVIPEEQGKRIR